jgi:flagellar hook protein FlgE
MGIQGSGFFVLSDNGALSYTRAGTFKADKDGYVTNTDGTARLQGYGVDANGKIVNGVLTDLRIDTSNLAPRASGSVESTINLNSSDVIDQVANKFDPLKSESYSKKSPPPFTTLRATPMRWISTWSKRTPTPGNLHPDRRPQPGRQPGDGNGRQGPSAFDHGV